MELKLYQESTCEIVRLRIFQITTVCLAAPGPARPSTKGDDENVGSLIYDELRGDAD